VHPEMLRDEIGDHVAVGKPVRDVVELRGIHSASLPIRYFRLSTARCSCCFVMRERPEMFMRLASL
jgi:hypothetical protein